jgi:hypothetical protein
VLYRSHSFKDLSFASINETWYQQLSFNISQSYVIMHLEILQTKQKYPFLTDSIKKNQLPLAE